MPDFPSSAHFTRDILDSTNFIISGRTFPPSSPNYVITALHGIRDVGIWASRLNYYCEKHEINIEVVPISYGWIDPLSFIFRAFWKRRRDKVSMEMDDIFDHYPNSIHCLISHSNGTKLTSDILSENPRNYRDIIFAGSVCLRKFKLNSENQNSTLVNYCCPGDIWPIFAQSLNPWAYEATGTYGFRQKSVHDRYISGGHSAALSETHFENNILPFIVERRLPFSDRPYLLFPSGSPIYLRILILLLVILAIII